MASTETDQRRTARMDQSATRTCPKCGSGDYQLRSRRKVAGENGQEMETKYRCKACQHEWKVRAAA
jgi:DNA-directed RNA polymerase subunit M/transcription elongation factor TFIIS